MKNKALICSIIGIFFLFLIFIFESPLEVSSQNDLNNISQNKKVILYTQIEEMRTNEYEIIYQTSMNITLKSNTLIKAPLKKDIIIEGRKKEFNGKHWIEIERIILP